MDSLSMLTLYPTYRTLMEWLITWMDLAHPFAQGELAAVQALINASLLPYAFLRRATLLRDRAQLGQALCRTIPLAST